MQDYNLEPPYTNRTKREIQAEKELKVFLVTQKAVMLREEGFLTEKEFAKIIKKASDKYL